MDLCGTCFNPFLFLFHFLYSSLLGFKAQALAVTTDPEHQFDLALHLGDLKTAVSVAANPAICTEQKWKQLAEVATRQCDFQLAQHCLHQVRGHTPFFL